MLSNKIEREIYTYMYCIYLNCVYDDISDQIGVSERTYYKYISELKVIRDEVKNNRRIYDFEKNNVVAVKDKHFERLKRLVSIIELSNLMRHLC